MKSKLFFCKSFRSKIFLQTFCAVTILVCAASAAFPSDDIQNIQDTKQLVKQAEKFYRSGNLDEAEKLYRRAIAQDATNSDVRLRLAYLLLKKRNITEAYEISFKIAEKEPKNSRAFAIFGMALLGVGNFKDAELVLRNSYILNKNEPLAWFGAGMLDFYENRISESLPKLEQAVYLDDNADFIFSLAQVLSRAEKYKEAGDAYERFLQVASINDKERRDRIRGLISFLRYIGSKSDLYIYNEDEGQTTVPITLVSQRPIIEIGVNGKKEKLRFVLDTGSGISVISDKTSERMNIKPVAKGGLARAIGGDGKFGIVYGFLKSLEIGDIKIRNVPVYIRKFHDDGAGVDGYIGLSLISKFLTTVDYGNLTFSLTKEKKNGAKLPESTKETLALPLRLTSSGFLSGEVSIEGFQSPYNFIVDTGASVSVISHGLASKDEMTRYISKDKIRVVGAAGVTESAPTFLLPKVSFGKHSREKIQAVALDLDIINEAAGFEQAGILGGNFLKNYCLTFDFKNSKVTFVPNKK